MIPELFLGIDPGLTGAIGLILTPQFAVSEHVDSFDMPTASHLGKRRVSPRMLATFLEPFAARIIRAAVESPQPVPKQGAIGIASFYKGVGACFGILSALKVEWCEVRPQDWKRKIFFNTGITPDKAGARKLVSQLYPNAVMQLGNRKDEGRAEAILIARYAQLFS